MTITIHHLHVSQSERIPRLCEELGVPYELKTYHRAPLLAPPEYKALHPAGTAPVVQDGDLTLAESGAIIEYIAHWYAGGRLFIPPSDPEYPHFLYWWHWASGTFMPSIGRSLAIRSAGITGLMADITKERLSKGLAAMDARLEDNEYLGGREFSVADILAVFPLTTMRYFLPLDLGDYKHILAWLQRIGNREAYQKTMRKIDPDMELALGAESPKPFVPANKA